MCSKSTKTAKIELNTESKEEIKENKETEQNEDIMRLSGPIEQSKKSARRPRTSYLSGKPGISFSRTVRRDLLPNDNIMILEAS